MAGKRQGGRPPGSGVRKRRPPVSSEDRLYGLYTQVNAACTKWLASRGIYAEGHCWTKKINYLGEDSES
jgi:hypothetical protein